MAVKKAEKTRTHFTFRIDTWGANGESIIEHVAGVEDYQIALATYRAACERWPSTPITLRQGKLDLNLNQERGAGRACGCAGGIGFESDYVLYKPRAGSLGAPSCRWQSP
jgi:hypothetical protein